MTDTEKKIAELQQEIERLKEERDAAVEGYQQQVKYAGELMTKLVSAQQELDMYKSSSEVYRELMHELDKENDHLHEKINELEKLKHERNKLIEGLRKLAKTNAENISEIREWKAKQNDPEVTDLDWYNYVARDILREVGVNVDGNPHQVV